MKVENLNGKELAFVLLEYGGKTFPKTFELLPQEELLWKCVNLAEGNLRRLEKLENLNKQGFQIRALIYLMKIEYLFSKGGMVQIVG